MSEPKAEFESMAAFLEDPATHGGAKTERGETRRIDTHTAAIVLAGERAWKLRRPVDYGWMDYATRRRRRICAAREIAWNRASAPGLYIGLGGILPDDGGWRLVPPGEVVPDEAEPLVVMHRFRQEDLFDRVAAEGRLSPPLIRLTGRVIADMHKAAPRREGSGRLPAFAGQETREMAELADLLGAEKVGAFSEKLRALAERHAGLAATRGARRCHGDLHLRNIVLWRDRPAPFDCIEFNDAFTDIDPLYDLAFLLMDLDHRGHGELGVEVFNAWAERMASRPGDELETACGGLALLPFFKACRAGIRAKVGALALRDRAPDDDGLAEPRTYLDLALRYLAAPRRPRLIAVGGISGSGKTTLARALAPRLDALVLRSDAIRKGLRGVDVTQRLPAEAYAPEVSVRVYEAMLDRARMALGGGATVILDAAHLRVAEREQAGALAAELGVPFVGLWLEAPLAEMKARVAARPQGASDATESVIERQTTYELGPVRWHRLAAGGSLDELVAAALAELER